MAKPSITTRTAKGTPLTIAEMDANLTNLKDGNVKVAVPGSRTQFYPSGMYSTSTAQKKFGDRSVEFNGSMNYIQIYNMSGSSPWDLGMSTFCAEQFIWIDSTGTGERAIFDTRQMGNNGLYVYIDSTGYLKAKRGDTEIATSASPITTDTWHHVAIERSTMGAGSFPSGVYLLVDGAVAGSWASSMDMFDNSSQINYGRNYNSSNYFKGYMDEIRWSKNTNRYMPNVPPYTTLNPAPTAELSSDYSTSYLFHCNDSSGLTDDYYSTMTLDLNDTLRFQTSNGIAMSADATNKQLTISYSSSNSPAGLVVKANNLTNGNYNGQSYNGVLSFMGSIAQYGSGIYTQSMGEFQIQNMSNSGSAQYLVEVYGNATFTGLSGSPNLQLYNVTDNYNQSSEQMSGGAMPILISSVNINSNSSKNFVVKIDGASGTESMTGTAVLKITKIS